MGKLRGKVKRRKKGVKVKGKRGSAPFIGRKGGRKERREGGKKMRRKGKQGKEEGKRN